MIPSSAPTQDRVAAVLARHPYGASVAQLASAAKLTPKRTSDVLARLVTQQRAVRIERGRYAPPMHAEAIAELRAELAALRAAYDAEVAAHTHTAAALAASALALAALRGTP